MKLETGYNKPIWFLIESLYSWHDEKYIKTVSVGPNFYVPGYKTAQIIALG